MKEPENYVFPVQTPRGVIEIKMPSEETRQCACGCDLFDLVYRIAYYKQPGILNAPLMTMRVEVYRCVMCKLEVSPETPTKKEVREDYETWVKGDGSEKTSN
jgi:hypothetical protein